MGSLSCDERDFTMRLEKFTMRLEEFNVRLEKFNMRLEKFDKLAGYQDIMLF